MEKIKLINIEALGTGTDLRDSLESSRRADLIILGWLVFLTMAFMYLFLKIN
jgi:hypothetical protein